MIADLGGRSVDWILTGAAPKSWSFAHRMGLLDRRVADEAGRQAVSAIVERFEAAEALGFAPPSVDLPPTRKHRRYLEEGNHLASEAVTRIGQPLRGLDTQDLIALIEAAFSVHVVVTSLPEGCDGLSYEEGALRVIVLGRTDRAARQRYTLAHELGHILWGDARQNLFEEDISQLARNHDESRANVFAASFLMPSEEVKAAVAQKRAVDCFAELVWQFEVSPDSMAWRLLNLGLVDAVQRAELAAKTSGEIAAQLGKFEEQLRRSQEATLARPPALLIEAYVEAYLAGEVTTKPLADLLGWSREEVETVFNEKSVDATWADNPETA